MEIPAKKQLMLVILVCSGCGISHMPGIHLGAFGSAATLSAAACFSVVSMRALGLRCFLHTDLVGNHPFTERGLLGRPYSTGRGNVDIAPLQLYWLRWHNCVCHGGESTNSMEDIRNSTEGRGIGAGVGESGNRGSRESRERAKMIQCRDGCGTCLIRALCTF